MNKCFVVGGMLAATVLSGCATVSPQTIECLAPNRRAEVEVVGRRQALPPKPKPGAEAEAKPKKPAMENIIHKGMVQGNWGFDYGAAVLKDDGKQELDKLVRAVTKGVGKDTRPTMVGAIVITGHIDRTEEEAGKQALGEARAVAVKDYLVSQGMDGKLMFWESKASKSPVPVTKFCEG